MPQTKRKSRLEKPVFDKAMLAWAAGLFEGEGCFTQARITNKGHLYQSPKAALQMTDEDVVNTFSRVVGVGLVSGPYGDPQYKPAWYWHVAGFEPVQQLVALLWPYLHNRRKERAVEILTAQLGRID